MAKIVYPLAEVMRIKEKRVEDAERNLQDKRNILLKEQEKLKERERERDKVKEHLEDKLLQFRRELDRSTTSPKIQQMKDYMKLVKENLANEEQKVKQQKEQVAIAEDNVEIAKVQVKERRKEVDKLVEHRKDWVKTMMKEIEFEEAKEQDEIGNITYSLHQRKNKEV